MSAVRVRCCRLMSALLLAWLASWLLLSGLALLLHADFLSDACTDAASKKILRRLCGDFAAGWAAGDMCADLCVRGLVEYKRCLYYESGKKVMEVRWRGRPVILKSKLENLSSYQPLGPLDYQDAAGDSSPLDVLLRATLEVRSWLGLAEEEGGAGSPLKLRSSDKIYTRAELTSLWSLLQQDEYAFLRVLQDLSVHVSKVLGSCGHFTHKVHLCDVKPENFAIRKDLTVVAIDVDMAFFQPKMEEILDHKCSADDDCSFFDCASSCDLGARHCRRRRANTNLQVICEKIFRLWFSPTLLGAKAGLPLQVELQRAVQECSESGGVNKQGLGGGGGRDVHRRLFRILTRLLHEGGKSDEEHETEGRTALNL
ncbi:divergent protein kinase domain 1C isoform X3 [Phyllopteryx taeniolatus]|uniref:divergent protein kinase domain 1C isoform X3 n=1 Tax=Phyllopteryx taeniolatus TaxID=161469 RepID=UPI002AD27EBC|nr:divergent protein kinase domain 1C isoform X3 [Phyllopteryx taeniolatus]